MTKSAALGPAAALACRLAVVASIVAACAGCDGGGGSETVMLRLASNAPCYGIEIDVDDAGLPAADSASSASCTFDADLAAKGCYADVAAGTGGLVLRTFRCFADDGAALFRCTMPRALASRLRDAAEVRCGCGCADECPSSPNVEVCDEAKGTCDAVALPGASVGAATDEAVSSSAADDEAAAEAVSRSAGANEAAAAPTKTVTRQSSPPQATTIASSTTFCGTCCDVWSEPVIRMTEPSAVRELEFDISLPADSNYCPDIGGCTLAAGGGSEKDILVSHNARHLCVSAPERLLARFQVATCNVTSGGFDDFTITNVRALDEHLRPVVAVLINAPN